MFLVSKWSACPEFLCVFIFKEYFQASACRAFDNIFFTIFQNMAYRQFVGVSASRALRRSGCFFKVDVCHEFSFLFRHFLERRPVGHFISYSTFLVVSASLAFSHFFHNFWSVGQSGILVNFFKFFVFFLSVGLSGISSYFS